MAQEAGTRTPSPGDVIAIWRVCMGQEATSRFIFLQIFLNFLISLKFSLIFSKIFQFFLKMFKLCKFGHIISQI